jgi:hypothetical protein
VKELDRIELTILAALKEQDVWFSHLTGRNAFRMDRRKS